jgi:hypothetical protein
MEDVVTNVNGTTEPVPTQLIGGGHHFSDSRDRRRAARQQAIRQQNVLPRDLMLQQVVDSGLRRPVPRPRTQ